MNPPKAAPPKVKGASSEAPVSSIANVLPSKVSIPCATAPPGTNCGFPSSTLRNANVSTAPVSRTLAIQSRATSPPTSPSTRNATSDSASGAGAKRRPACSIIRQASNKLISLPPESPDKRINGTSSAISSFQSSASNPTGSAALTLAGVDSLAKKRSNISFTGTLSFGKLSCISKTPFCILETIGASVISHGLTAQGNFISLLVNLVFFAMKVLHGINFEDRCCLFSG